jgi:hypothetical protein
MQHTKGCAGPAAMTFAQNADRTNVLVSAEFRLMAIAEIEGHDVDSDFCCPSPRSRYCPPRSSERWA